MGSGGHRSTSNKSSQLTHIGLALHAIFINLTFDQANSTDYVELRPLGGGYGYYPYGGHYGGGLYYPGGFKGGYGGGGGGYGGYYPGYYGGGYGGYGGGYGGGGYGGYGGGGGGYGFPYYKGYGGYGAGYGQGGYGQGGYGQGGYQSYADAGRNLGGYKGNNGYYEDLLANKNAYDHGKIYGGGHDYGKTGLVGAGYKDLAGRNKGHTSTGFSTSYRKDESGDKSSYYDDGLGHHNKLQYGAYDNRFQDLGGAARRGGHHDTNLNRNTLGQSGRYGDYLNHKGNYGGGYGDQGGYGGHGGYGGGFKGFRHGRRLVTQITEEETPEGGTKVTKTTTASSGRVTGGEANPMPEPVPDLPQSPPPHQVVLSHPPPPPPLKETTAILVIPVADDGPPVGSLQPVE